MQKEKRERHEKKHDDIQWDNKPNSIFGWVLYMFPEKYWKTIIGVVTLFIAIVAVWGTILLFTQRQLDINDKTKNRILKEKLKYWHGSDDPALKSGLLKLWNKRGDVPEEIWNNFNPNEDTEILIAMASNPWVPEDIKKKLLENEDERVRVASVLNGRNRYETIQLLSKDKEYAIRNLVANNINTPAVILKQLERIRAFKYAVPLQGIRIPLLIL